jgi:hypothetical protein
MKSGLQAGKTAFGFDASIENQIFTLYFAG